MAHFGKLASAASPAHSFIAAKFNSDSDMMNLLKKNNAAAGPGCVCVGGGGDKKGRTRVSEGW